ncbi:MAG TPA: hypothetical protein VKV26_00985 [Dehalococcoidia bacterium]|nr:hypothetical protein [Dehalococcoidia bacterium]
MSSAILGVISLAALIAAVAAIGGCAVLAVRCARLMRRTRSEAARPSEPCHHAAPPLVVGILNPPLLPHAERLPLHLSNIGSSPALQVEAVLSWGNARFGLADGARPYIPLDSVWECELLRTSARATDGPETGAPLSCLVTFHDMFHRRFAAVSVYSISAERGLCLERVDVETPEDQEDGGGESLETVLGRRRAAWSAPPRPAVRLAPVRGAAFEQSRIVALDV